MLKFIYGGYSSGYLGILFWFDLIFFPFLCLKEKIMKIRLGDGYGCVAKVFFRNPTVSANDLGH